MCHCGQVQHADSLTRQHIQITDAKKLIEDLKSDRQTMIAQTKQQLEARDKEVTRCHEIIRQTQTENDSLKAELEQAQQSGTVCISSSEQRQLAAS